MATPPTVLADTSSPTPQPVSPTRPSFGPLLIAVLIGVAVSAIGGATTIYVLARMGRLPARSAKSAEGKSVVAATHLVPLDPLVVNLADTSGTAYLKISLVLQVADVADGKKTAQAEESSSSKSNDSESVVAARDAALAVLSSQTSDALLAPDGKERLKAELKSAITAHDQDVKVIDIFFTDFLVQR